MKSNRLLAVGGPLASESPQRPPSDHSEVIDHLPESRCWKEQRETRGDLDGFRTSHTSSFSPSR